MNGESYRVVGIMPPSFDFPMARDLWVPLALEPNEIVRGAHYLQVVGRMGGSRSLDEAQSEMSAIATRLESAYPEANQGHQARVVSLREELVGHAGPLLLRLLGMAGLVLLIACANAANLWLARTLGRARELALCRALGAGRARLGLQLFAEGLMLTLTAGGLGLGISVLSGGALLRRLVPELALPVEIAVRPSAIAFTVALAVLAALLFALVSFTPSSLPGSMKHGTRISAWRGGQALRKLLVVTQVALALICLIGASLMFRSFSKLLRVDPGFATAGILTARLSLPPNAYPEPSARSRFFEELLGNLEARAEVASAGATSILPLSGGEAGRFFSIEGRPRDALEVAPNARIRLVSPGFFRTMSIPLLRGRYFTDRDDVGRDPVAIVDETLARHYWSEEDPLEKRIRFGGHGGDGYTIVGVVGDVRHGSPVEEPNGHLYLSSPQERPGSMTIVMRSIGEPLALIDGLREEVGAIDPDLPIAAIDTMEALRARSLASPRELRTLFTIFAAIAIGLAAGGLHALVSYLVSRRTHEMAIRMALGARLSNLLRLIFRQGMGLVALGIFVAFGASLYLGRWVESLLFEVSAFDLASLFGSALLLSAITALSILLGSYRASRIHPAAALRSE